MSKIHQAMKRAEKEGRSSPFLPTLSTEEVMARPIPLATSGAFSPHLEKDLDLTADLTDAVQETTNVDSRVAVSHDAYDGLGTRFSSLKADALAAGKDLKSILLTSAACGEGKSLTATNVSITVSRMSGQRVLLIDGNLRHPSVHELLGMSRSRGLSDLLGGSGTAPQFISRTNLSNLFVVTAGAATKNPTELLNTRRMSDFLALAKKQFDWVFLDAPAIIPEPDAELMSSLVDGVILIVGRQSRPASILEAVRLLRGRNLLGAVLNGKAGSVCA